MQRQYDYIIKIVLVGSSAVGKSAILKRFADNDFNEFYISTIGIDFRFKSVPINDYYVKLQIWDTAGQERFMGIAKSYYNNADVVIMVYDVGDDKSFNEIKNLWLNQVHKYCHKDIKLFVMCNKCDTPMQSMKPAHRTFFQQQNIGYFVVSAKVGKGVQQAIMTVAKQMIKILPKVQEKSLSMELRDSHFEGDGARRNKEKKCC